MHEKLPNQATYHGQIDWKQIREKLQRSSGQQYWRSLEELTDHPEFREILRSEFPQGDPIGMAGVSRRNFMRLMAASMALAGLTACGGKPKELILPYARAPEDIVPGKPLYFATAMTMAGSAMGLLVETHEGRPTKIEGNPSHPASLGATDVFAQASILGLYDPDRSKAVTYLGDIQPWQSLQGQIQGLLQTQRSRRGAGLRLLTGTVLSPTLASQIRNLLREYPEARWHQYEPCGRDSVREGARLAFGRPLNTIYQPDKADAVVSLDSDFLTSGPMAIRLARQFAGRRQPESGDPAMNRLYVVEPTPSSTGVKADHRLALRFSEIEQFARQLAAAIQNGPESIPDLPYRPWLQVAARDLLEHRGTSVVMAGDQQPAAVHAWAHIINDALGNVGSTVRYTELVEEQPVNQIESLRSLVEEMDRGEVDWLVILGGNPVYNAPADFYFGERLLKVPVRMHLSPYADETSALCQWHIPEAHYLEAWSDGRAFDGTVSIVQPVIAPLYEGKSAHEFLAAFTNRPEQSSHDIVQAFWGAQRSGKDFEKFWRKSLHDGVIEGSAFRPLNVKPSREWQAIGPPIGNTSVNPPESQPGNYEIIFRPDPSLYDGRFANNGWLQELPKPITRLTWDNAALVSPEAAEQLGLTHRIDSTAGEHGQVSVDIIEIVVGDRSVQAPAWVVPGQAGPTITLHLGYGRTQAGQVGNGTGFNSYPLRAAASPNSISSATVRKTGRQVAMACVQFHHTMEGRDLIRAATLSEYHSNPAFASDSEHGPEKPGSLYPGFSYNDYAWGMAIDLNSCVGCNACVVACQAENNIPIVGKAEVMRGREMHWIRIDHYHRGSLDDPERYFQPVPCMQCENAPCELVCPVGATVHSAEGLNDMVYNRCIGTRYCSNNCPYKVRRFNFLQYSDWETPVLKLLRNPDVTVRSRGVMEKCTYCVQRINHGRITAEKENRAIHDGEIRPACQQACPAEAIIFGNINDPQSRVSQWKASRRNYGLLEHLNTKPRTTYLAEVRNPNPNMPPSQNSLDKDENGI